MLQPGGYICQRRVALPLQGILLEQTATITCIPSRPTPAEDCAPGSLVLFSEVQVQPWVGMLRDFVREVEKGGVFT